MIEVRPFAMLAEVNQPWLRAKHHFPYADPQRGLRPPVGAIRMWNDDEFAPGSGFPLHPHASMEIITYVRQGAITHEDNLGNAGRTTAGNVQVMSAGDGIRHSEFNLESIPTKIFQIWIAPRQPGGQPMWASRAFPEDARNERFTILASGYLSDAGALGIRADARVLAATIAAGRRAVYEFAPGRQGYLVPVRGAVEVNGAVVHAQDGAWISGETALDVVARDTAEVVLVDVA